MKSYLMHYGIAGQKWGVRRYQNPDGTLTEEGKQRYYDSLTDEQKKAFDRASPKEQEEMANLEAGKGLQEASDRALAKRKESLDRIQRDTNVKALIQSASFLSVAAAGRILAKKYPSNILGHLLKSFGKGALVGTGIGYVFGTAGNRIAKNIVGKEEDRRRFKG